MERGKARDGKIGRLKFKKKTNDVHKVSQESRNRTKSREYAKIQSSDSTESESESDFEISTPKASQSSKKPKLCKNSLDITVEEWGPSINGYRFINTDSKKLDKPKNYYQQRHKLVYGDKSMNSTDSTGFDWSYKDMPTFQKNSFDCLSEKYSKNPNDYSNNEENSNYDGYIKHWKRVRNGEISEIRDLLRFPVLDGDDISVFNIEKFLKSGSPDLAKTLKQERIRWHPDKMFQLLNLSNESEKSSELKDMIKLTFQCINEIWERTHM